MSFNEQRNIIGHASLPKAAAIYNYITMISFHFVLQIQQQKN